MSGSLRCDFLAPEDGRWTALLSKVNHDFYHLPSYVRMCAQMDNGEPGAFYVAEPGYEFLLPVIVRDVPPLGGDEPPRWRDATGPYGYPSPLVATDQDSDASAAFLERALAAVFTLMRERRILTAFVRFHPMLQIPLEPFAQVGNLVMHGNTVSVDLSRSPEEIWSGVRSNHQRHIKALENLPDVRAEEDLTWSCLPDFIAAYLATMERVKASASYYFDGGYFAALRQALGTGVHLMATNFGERFAAGAVVTEYCGVVQYHLVATNSEFSPSAPQKLLCRNTWLWAQRRGARALHLGGGVGGKEDNVFHFKAGFSDRRHPFYTWRACSDAQVYEQMAAAWRTQNAGEPENIDFFPAYRRPRTVQAPGTH